jgi:hypothetical protein
MSGEKKKYSKAERKWIDGWAKYIWGGENCNGCLDDTFMEAELALAESIKRYGPLDPEIESVQPNDSQ